MKKNLRRRVANELLLTLRTVDGGIYERAKITGKLDS